MTTGAAGGDVLREGGAEAWRHADRFGFADGVEGAVDEHLAAAVEGGGRAGAELGEAAGEFLREPDVVLVGEGDDPCPVGHGGAEEGHVAVRHALVPGGVDADGLSGGEGLHEGDGGVG